MATVWAIASGYVSDGAIWNTGVVPGIDDMVYADGKNLIIDMDWQVGGLRTTARSGGTAGGSFTITGSYSISALQGYIGGSSTSAIQVHSNSPNTVIINGDISFNTVAGKTLEIIGNADVYIIGNSGVNYSNNLSNATYYNSTGGTLHISGNIIGGTHGWGIGHQSNSTGLTIWGSGNVIHTGNLSANGVEAVSVRGTGTFSSTGTATSSTTMPAIYSTGANNVYYNGVLIMQTPPAAQIPVIYQGTTGTGCVYFKGIAINKSTTMAIYAIRMGLMSTGSTQWTFKDELGVDKVLYSTDSGMFGYPAEADTRDGVVYGQANEFLGTLKVPAPESVVENVPTDHTVGSYKLTQSNIEAYVTNAVAAIKARTDLIPDHPASVESTGGQIGAI